MITNQYLTVSRALADTPGLSVLLAGSVRYQPAWSCWPLTTGQQVMLAWGRKASAVKAEQVAKRCRLPVCYIEDAFLRSIGQGFNSAPSGLVVDDLGIYYDATMPSRLECYIADELNDSQLAEANALAQLWREHRVSKYNNAQDYQLQVEQPYVLLIDQTYNDASVSGGLANAASFLAMLRFAQQKFSTHKLIIKTHPDVVAGKKRGYLAELSPAQLQGAQLMSEPLHVVALLEHASAVFTVTSQVGFEALLWQKPVYVFGMPFYAGWGLTYDAQQAPQRRALLRQQLPTVDISRLAYASLIRYGRYVTGDKPESCSFYKLIQTLGKRVSGEIRPVRKLSSIT